MTQRAEVQCSVTTSLLAWRIPQTEEPGGLQSMGVARVRHDWSDTARIHVTTSRGGMGWEVGGRLRKDGRRVYLWLMHVDGRQGPPQRCKAIILQ